jgi:hypothetical protein
MRPSRASPRTTGRLQHTRTRASPIRDSFSARDPRAPGDARPSATTSTRIAMRGVLNTHAAIMDASAPSLLDAAARDSLPAVPTVPTARTAPTLVVVVSGRL